MTKSETDAAKLLGRKGGLSKSEAKAESSRQNGKKGGRPRTKGIPDGTELAEKIDAIVNSWRPKPTK